MSTAITAKISIISIIGTIGLPFSPARQAYPAAGTGSIVACLGNGVRLLIHRLLLNRRLCKSRLLDHGSGCGYRCRCRLGYGNRCGSGRRCCIKLSAAAVAEFCRGGKLLAAAWADPLSGGLLVFYLSTAAAAEFSSVSKLCAAVFTNNGHNIHSFL